MKGLLPLSVIREEKENVKDEDLGDRKAAREVTQIRGSSLCTVRMIKNIMAGIPVLCCYLNVSGTIVACKPSGINSIVSFKVNKNEYKGHTYC